MLRKDGQIFKRNSQINEKTEQDIVLNCKKCRIKKIKKWEPDDFELEMTTHWSFPKRGDWATHDAKWRGNWSPYIPRNIPIHYRNIRERIGSVRKQPLHRKFRNSSSCR